MSAGPLLGTGLGPGAAGWAQWVGMGGALVATVPAGLRWLRVSQREHYLAGAASRFALRWARSRPENVLLALGAVAGVVLAVFWPLGALVSAAAVALGPVGLAIRGRTARLALTRRLRLQGALWALVQLGVVGVGVALGAPALAGAAGAVGVPLVVDGAAGMLAPVERRLVRPYVRRARARLLEVGPRVVAITGSYGKTSTKNHVRHLLGPGRAVVASPASFNNRAGLARAVNENLAAGTEVFVAEMGTYGPGEIAEMCAWCPPEIAVMTAIGPVHLERFGSEDAIVEAKAEIVARAEVLVVNVDDPRLAALAARLAGGPRPLKVVACSGTGPEGGAGTAPGEGPVPEVAVARSAEAVSVWVQGRLVAKDVGVGPGIQAGNLACAIGVGLVLGATPEELAGRIGDLPGVPNRLVAARAPSGVTVLDDTFNANPAGARAALRALSGLAVRGRRIVVTPGMVELGTRQAAENAAFGREIAARSDGAVVVGRTNRRALLEGAGEAVLAVVDTREEAVGWVRSHLGEGDAVLYENDLPDHYP